MDSTLRRSKLLNIYISLFFIAFLSITVIDYTPFSSECLLALFLLGIVETVFTIRAAKWGKGNSGVAMTASLMFVLSVSYGISSALYMDVVFMVALLIWKCGWNTLFIPAMQGISTLVGYLVFLFLGGTVGTVNLYHWWAYVGFWLAFFVSNTVSVSIFLSLRSMVNPFTVIREGYFQMYGLIMYFVDFMFGVIMVFAQRDIGIIGIFFVSAVLWAFVEVHRLMVKMVEEAHYDALTAIPNRRAFIKDFDKEIRKCQEFSLLIADVDHFKAFNDQFGHQLGDVLLKKIAMLLQAALECKGAPYRYGGEEFAIILPNTNSKSAWAIAEDIRKKIGDLSEIGPSSSGLTNSVTISIGIAAYPSMTTDSKELIQFADMALYQAKAKSRNKTIIFEG